MRYRSRSVDIETYLKRDKELYPQLLMAQTA